MNETNSIKSSAIDWCIELPEAIWFQIGKYSNINDIHRLSRTCSHLHMIFTSQYFWSFLIRSKFGRQVWNDFIRNSSLNKDNDDDTSRRICPAKSVFLQLTKRRRISVTDGDHCLFDKNRNYTKVAEASSLTGLVVSINDVASSDYSIRIQIVFENVLPGKYDVIWRMKLDFPFLLGQTEFIAVPFDGLLPRNNSTYVRWTQDDFFSMYECFHCESTKTNLWFYQNMGLLEVTGVQFCDVWVSMINEDRVHAKHGILLDYVELKRRFD